MNPLKKNIEIFSKHFTICLRNYSKSKKFSCLTIYIENIKWSHKCMSEMFTI